MSGFTKGPWPLKRSGDGKRIVVGEGLVGGPNGYEVAEVYSDDCDPEEARANAHLIGAAPELYEALESCLKELWDSLHSGMSREQFEREFASELAALAKARGDTPR